MAKSEITVDVRLGDMDEMRRSLNRNYDRIVNDANEKVEFIKRHIRETNSILPSMDSLADIARCCESLAYGILARTGDILLADAIMGMKKAFDSSLNGDNGNE